MNKIERRSCIFKVLFQCAFWLMPIYAFLYWLMVYWYYNPAHYHALVISHNPLIQLAGFILSLIPIAIIMYILRQLVHLFKNYEQHKIFHIDNVNLYHKIGKGLMIVAIVRWFTQVAINFILTIHVIGFHMSYDFTGFAHSLVLFIIGAITVLISWVMSEAYKISSDSAEII